MREIINYMNNNINKNSNIQRVTIINVTKNKTINFLSLNIRKSIDEICHYVDIKIPFSERIKINKHDKIKIMYYCEYFTKSKTRPITTLLVDEITTTINQSSKSVSVIARSPARDIVDSSYSDTISSMSLLNVVKQIAQKFNVAAEHYPTKVDASPPVDSFNFENESPWSKLLNIAENNNYAVASSQVGNLYVWKKNQRIMSLPFHKLVEGQNVKSVQYTENGAYQYCNYVVKGNSNDATSTDATINSKRCCCLVMTDSYISQVELENRAKSEMRKRKCNTLILTVPGFGLLDEQIKKLATTEKTEVFYEANQSIPVIIPSLNIKKNMVIKDVEYNLSNEDFSCNLTLVEPEVIQ